MVSPCNAGASCGCSVMNKLIYACVAAALAVVSFGATEKVALKTGWRFVKGDDPAAGTNLTIKAMSAMLDRACVGDVSGAHVFAWAKPEFDDYSWGEVRVPHDWGVEKPFDSDRAYGDAFLDVTGIGWYRLKFRVEGGKLKVGDGEVEIPGNGCVFFECDGAMSYAMLYVNGSFAGGWPYGYTRWRVDITSLLSSGGENTLAIRCCNVADSSRWYTGGGLYRNCRLLVCPEDYVLPGSVFITTPEVTAKRARVHVRYEMSKSGKKDYSFTARDPLFGAKGSQLPNIDMHCPATCFWNPAQAKRARRDGRKVWWYFCNNPASPYANMTLEGPPCEIRSLMGAQTQKFKPDGFLYYATTHWYAKEPIKEGPFTKWEPRSYGAYHGDGQWTCCGGPDNMPLPTIRLENFRDGVEDLWYVKLLEKKLHEVESGKLIIKSVGSADAKRSHALWMQRARKLLSVPDDVVKSLGEFSTDPDIIYRWRNEMAELIECAK